MGEDTESHRQTLGGERSKLKISTGPLTSELRELISKEGGRIAGAKGFKDTKRGTLPTEPNIGIILGHRD